MTEIFNTVLDMSITASLVIIAVLLVRLLLKKAPKKWSYALWLLVLLRLLCPISIESGLSLIPAQSRNIPQNTALNEEVDTLAAIDAAQRAVGDTLNGGIEPILINIDRPETKGIETVSASHSQVWLLFFARLWPVGIAAMPIWKKQRAMSSPGFPVLPSAMARMRNPSAFGCRIRLIGRASTNWKTVWSCFACFCLCWLFWEVSSAFLPPMP